jgi:hypothetical protein
MHINTTNFILTGTNFGTLGSFPRAEYFNGYYFTDFLGNDDLNYSKTISGGIFLEQYKESEIPTNGMLFWLDASDITTITHDNSGNITSIMDKSNLSPITVIGYDDTLLVEDGILNGRPKYFGDLPGSDSHSLYHDGEKWVYEFLYDGFEGIEVRYAYSTLSNASRPWNAGIFTGQNILGDVSFNVNGVSTNEKDFTFKGEVDILSAYWPVFSTGDFTTEQEILSNFTMVSGSTLRCARFLQNAYLGTSGINLNFNEGPFTFYMVWVDNNKQYRSIPFSIKTKTGTLSSEFIAHINYDPDSLEPAIAWGTRGSGTGTLNPEDEPIGFRITPLSSAKLFNSPSITYYNSPLGGDFNVYKVDVNNTSLKPDDSYFHTYYFNTPFTTMGYLEENNFNDFYFGEIIAYERQLSETEENNIFNYLAKKWYFLENTRENATFNSIVCGGVLKNTFYEDIVVRTSYFDIPIQECTTMLSIVLSSFDISTGDISKVVCDYENNSYKIETPINIDLLSAFNINNNRKIDILLNPDGKFHRDTYSIYLSVYKFDTTINKIVLSGELLKCGIKDFYYENYLLDSQLSNTSNKLFIVNEDRINKQMFVNSINITTPNQAISGGYEMDLINNEFLESQESTVSLLQLLGLAEEQVVVYRRPLISTVINPYINPIAPNINPVSPT